MNSSTVGQPAIGADAAYDPNDIIATDHDLFSATLTLASGQNVTRGTVLGQITSGGKLNKSLSAAVDGSQVPMAIAAEDKDASAGDKSILVYLAGGFKEGRLTFGASHTAASTKVALAQKGIYLYDEQVY